MRALTPFALSYPLQNDSTPGRRALAYSAPYSLWSRLDFSFVDAAMTTSPPDATAYDRRLQSFAEVGASYVATARFGLRGNVAAFYSRSRVVDELESDAYTDLSVTTYRPSVDLVYVTQAGLEVYGGIEKYMTAPAIVASESQATIPVIQLRGGADPQTDRGLLNPVSVVRATNLDLYRSMYPTDTDAIERKMLVLDYLRDSIVRMNEEVSSNDRLSDLQAAEEKIRTQFANNVGSNLELTDTDRAPFTTGAPAGMRRDMAESFAMAAKLIKSDIVTCVNLGIGGFDTHSNQTASLQGTLTNVDFVISTLISELRAVGALDNILIVLYSDFGRTPKINRSNGRDHWPVGGALMIGGGIDGGRAVSGTDDDLRAFESIDATTGLANTGGIQLNPTHLGGAVLALTLGENYLQYRPYLTAVPALTRLKSG